MESMTFRAMNSDIVLAAEGQLWKVERGMEETRAWIHEQEQRFTRFSPTSELSRLNGYAGDWVVVSPDLYELLGQAAELHQQTEGLFDPTILDALENAGYDRSMDAIRASGAGTAHSVPSARASFGDIQFVPSAKGVRLPPLVRVDLGGIAKGWIAERAALQLSHYANACAVSAGGDLFTIGLPVGASAWEIELEDPRKPEATLAYLHVLPGAVATSSVVKRSWKQQGRTRHHLIDPRTGEPAVTDWLSVTVIAPHATLAETFAKALLIAGAGEANRIASKRTDLAFVGVDTTGRLIGSSNAVALIEPVADLPRAA